MDVLGTGKKKIKKSFSAVSVPMWWTKLSGSRENKSKMHVASPMKSLVTLASMGTSSRGQPTNTNACLCSEHEKEIDVANQTQIKQRAVFDIVCPRRRRHLQRGAQRRILPSACLPSSLLLRVSMSIHSIFPSCACVFWVLGNWMDG